MEENSLVVKENEFGRLQGVTQIIKWKFTSVTLVCFFHIIHYFRNKRDSRNVLLYDRFLKYNYCLLIKPSEIYNL